MGGRKGISFGGSLVHSEATGYGIDVRIYVDYLKGANVAGFVKVVDSMLAQGIL